MLAVLLEANTSKSVIHAISQLGMILGLKKLKEMFPVLLTDNECASSNPMRIEADLNGEI